MGRGRPGSRVRHRAGRRPGHGLGKPGPPGAYQATTGSSATLASLGSCSSVAPTWSRASLSGNRRRAGRADRAAPRHPVGRCAQPGRDSNGHAARSRGASPGRARRLFDKLDPEAPTVVYCAGGHRSLSPRACCAAAASATSRTFSVATAPGPRRGSRSSRAIPNRVRPGLTELRQPAFVGGEHVVGQLPYFVERTHGGGEGVEGHGLADHLPVPLQVALDDELLDGDIAPVEGGELRRQSTHQAGMDPSPVHQARGLRRMLPRAGWR